MNVFILNAGRTGSTSFVRACEHITNYTAAHESRWGRLGDDRFAYPEQHIEADNRLSWFLGRLDRTYGTDAFYVHLRRDDAATARSFGARRDIGIMRAYRRGLVRGIPMGTSSEAIALDYLDTVNSNIELFLRDKPQRMTFQLENASEDFATFWERIGAEGSYEAAVAEFAARHNATDGRTFTRKKDRKKKDRRVRAGSVRRAGRRLLRPLTGPSGKG